MTLSWPALVAAVCGASLTAQTPVFRSRIDAVRLDVSVTEHNQAVPGLTANDFVVTDNGVREDVVSAELDPAPLSILLALDTSASMEGEKLRQLVGAATELVDSLRDEDRAAIVGFSHEINIEVMLTADRSRLEQALASLRARGATALRDALYATLQVRPQDDSRPVLLLFTDGEDTGSWLTEPETLDAVRRSGVTIETIDIREILPRWLTVSGNASRRAAAGSRFLEQVADVSGGRRWSGNSSRDLHNLFSRALADMRARYVLTFYPRGVSSPGWHKLEVKLKKGSADVHTRPGYFVANRSPE
jgi:VWFA-related protein